MWQDEFKKFMEKNGLSQDKVARKVSEITGTFVNAGKISRWLRGKYEPDISEAAALAKIAGLSLDALFGHDPISREERMASVRQSGRKKLAKHRPGKSGRAARCGFGVV